MHLIKLTDCFPEEEDHPEVLVNVANITLVLVEKDSNDEPYRTIWLTGGAQVGVKETMEQIVKLAQQAEDMVGMRIAGAIEESLGMPVLVEGKDPSSAH